MSKTGYKLLFFMLLFGVQQPVFATGGIGFTAGAGLEHWSDEKGEQIGAIEPYYEVRGRRELRNAGMVIDSNLSGRKLAGYRFSLLRETNKPGDDKVFEFSGIGTTHDIGFGIVRNRNIRLWAGPRFHIGLSEDVKIKTDANVRNTEGTVWSYGVGPVVGLNINSIDVITFSFTYAYMYRRYYGDFFTENATGGLIADQDVRIDSSGSYLNASIMFRFGN